jgi:cardiolipin synthase A/B
VLGIVDRVGAIGFAIGHIVLAICVTIHVLFHKRDVGSSFGWIGLAWFSPILGSVLYLIFGINRVKRRANQLRDKRPSRYATESSDLSAGRDDHLAPLERAGDEITKNPAKRGNEITILRSGDDAYPKMIAAIDAAKSSIALSSYIFRADDVGGQFIDALIRANLRGVAVRVLIDGIGGGYFISPTYARLRQHNVPVFRFMHSIRPWRMSFLNLRIHKKILALDGRIAFIGGLNIGDENMLASRPRHLVRDTHFKLDGPVVTQIVEAFAEDWLFAANESLAGEAWFPPLRKTGEAVARVIVAGPDENIEKIEFMILEAVACARRTVKVMNPYFLPDDRMVNALALASMRGVEVDVIIPTHGNHAIVNCAIRAQIRPLIAAGCRIWRSPPPFDHSKLMTVDGIWCMIGSANWDVRSFRLNFELNIEVYHTRIVGDLDNQMTASLGSLITLTELDELPFPVKLIDNSARLMLPYL